MLVLIPGYVFATISVNFLSKAPMTLPPTGTYKTYIHRLSTYHVAFQPGYLMAIFCVPVRVAMSTCFCLPVLSSLCIVSMYYVYAFVYDCVR